MQPKASLHGRLWSVLAGPEGANTQLLSPHPFGGVKGKDGKERKKGGAKLQRPQGHCRTGVEKAAEQKSCVCSRKVRRKKLMGSAKT